MRARFALAILSVAACSPDGGPPMSATPDAQKSRVSGCDDPAVWTLPALTETEAEYRIGLGECEPAQLPLQRVRLRWKEDYGFEAEQHKLVDRACWRVTEATPGSGWTAGQMIISDWYQAAFNIVGFARPITVEGRALFQDGTIAYSIPPTKIELAPATIVEPNASTVTAIIGPEGWVEHDAVRVWGQRIPTEEVLGAARIDVSGSEPITLHRIGANLVRRWWTHVNNQVQYKDLVIGAGTRGQLTKRGNAVLVDGTELVLLNQSVDNVSVRSRVTLPAEPLEMVDADTTVWVHLPGKIMRVGILDAASRTLAVGDGVLVPVSDHDGTYFFDGATFHRLQWAAQQIQLVPMGFTPAADDLARLGKPVGFVGDVLFGENGLLSVDERSEPVDPIVGPASASYADLFGEGHLGPLFVDDATSYVIVHEGGSAELYQAPHNGYCNPI
ncbi:MAG: hypothetical protein HOV81_45215 [Kofleriaceae bacterium]|nr:hypothetical protein [Kofleriaceae bacterium]